VAIIVGIDNGISGGIVTLDPPQPAEDPEEWVDLPKDHRIRAEIDWYDYGGVFDYVCKGSTLIGVRVGDTQAKKARCLRKDLPKPAEDPEEWVEITDPEHVLRRLVDHYFSTELNEWTTVFESHGKKWRESNVKDLRVRCRRKDLPAPPKPRRTITVPKWLVIPYSGSPFVTEQSHQPVWYKEVHRVGETTYEIEGE